MTALGFLYGTVPGRLCLKALTRPGLSRAVGRFLDAPASKFLIDPFVKRAKIDLSQFESDGFTCFNDCFSRRIKDGKRPVDISPGALIFPSFFRSAISSMLCMLSSFASLIKQQVLTIAASASVSSSVNEYPRSTNCESMTSESTRFLSQPKETSRTFTVPVSVFIIILLHRRP